MEINSLSLCVSDEAFEDFAVRVAERRPLFEEMVEWLERNVQR